MYVFINARRRGPSKRFVDLLKKEKGERERENRISVSSRSLLACSRGAASFAPGAQANITKSVAYQKNILAGTAGQGRALERRGKKRTLKTERKEVELCLPVLFCSTLGSAPVRCRRHTVFVINGPCVDGGDVSRCASYLIYYK